MLRSFERRFDLKCSSFFHSQRDSLTELPRPRFPHGKMRQHITPVSLARNGKHGNSNADWLHAKSKTFTSRRERRKFASDCFSKIEFCFGQLVLGLASGLEAFSREPPCDSIGALAVRQTPETSGMAWEFLSYYPKLPSRCLRDPLRYLVDEKVRKNPNRTAAPSTTALRGPKHSPRTSALRA